MGKKRFSRKDTREIAIEFAKYLMNLELSKSETEQGIQSTISYRPIEFDVMLGELEFNSHEIFESFIDYYAELQM